MALSGGAADKLGNRYEDWWTLWRVADVLEGVASAIRLEPPGPEGEGAEFWVDDADGHWFEQVKSRGRPWTVAALQPVLGGFHDRLAAGSHMRLVVASGAPELEKLADQCRAVAPADDYTSILTSTQLEHLDTVASWWTVTREEALGCLRRVFVEHHPQKTLRRLVTARYEQLVVGNADAVLNQLRGWFDDQLHQEVTAPAISDYLKKAGIRRRPHAGDDNTVAALEATLDRHQRRTGRTEPWVGLVARTHTEQVLDALRATDAQQIVLLHGRAGSGKSTIVSQTLASLAAEGWFAAVVRMDGVPEATHTARRLGEAFDLAGSPAVMLASVAAGRPAVLVIDQLDAVSQYSGRMPDAFDAVDEVLDQVRAFPNVRILLVARTVDLEGDPRLRQLSHDDAVTSVIAGDLDADQVAETLITAGIDPSVLSPTTLELLRVPLHLAVFSRIAPDARVATYRTLPDLYAQFTTDVRAAINDSAGAIPWWDITRELVDHMSANETVTAPVAVLDAFSEKQVGALESHAVLVRDTSRFGFFHESYFDYLFARSFIAAGHDLHEFLVASGQQLFRRAQTRQVLEHLAGVDRARFRYAAVKLLSSTTIRSHLLDVVVTVLRQLDATAEDWSAVEDLAFGESRVARRLLPLLSRPAWFDAADATGRWQTWLADPERRDKAMRQLVFVARDRASRVADLVRPHVGESEEWGQWLRALVEWSLTPGLVDLAVELAEKGILDQARGPIAVNSDFWSIMHGIVDDDADAAARLAGAYLRRQFERAVADGSIDPFASDHLARHSPGGDSTIRDIAAHAPRSFLREILPFVRAVAEGSAPPAPPGELRHSAEWGYRSLDGDGIPGALFNGLDDALIRLAADEPTAALDFVADVARSDVEELRFLACRVYKVAGPPDAAARWLADDERNLDLGWLDSPRWASRELIAAASARCSDAALRRLAGTLMTYYPPWERTPRGVKARAFGHAQFELLSAIDPARRSPGVARRLAELERKFEGLQPRAPAIMEAQFADSPIARDHAVHMKDNDWLKALRKYAGSGTSFRGDDFVGGARELSRVLGERATAEPQRFAALMMRFGTDMPVVAFEAVIGAVAGRVDVDVLADVCEHASHITNSKVGAAVCRAVEAVAATANERLVALVEDYANDPDPTPDQQVMAVDGIRDLDTAGLNSVRGAAAHAVARVLFAGTGYVDQLVPVIDRLVEDGAPSVRSAVADAVLALLNHCRADALELADRLFGGDVDVELFGSRAVTRLLRYAVVFDADRFAPHLARALAGPDRVARHAGTVWAQGYVNDALRPPVPSDIAALPAVARLGAAEALDSVPSLAPEAVKVLLHDEDAAVRAEIASAARYIADMDDSAAATFTAEFVESPAFAEHFDELFHGLAASVRLLPEAAIDACERAVALASGDLGDIRTHRALTAEHILSVVLRLYQQGNAKLRHRCLDVIDALSDVGAYGLEKALDKR